MSLKNDSPGPQGLLDSLWRPAPHPQFGLANIHLLLQQRRTSWPTWPNQGERCERIAKHIQIILKYLKSQHQRQHISYTTLGYFRILYDYLCFPKWCGQQRIVPNSVLVQSGWYRMIRWSQKPLNSMTSVLRPSMSQNHCKIGSLIGWSSITLRGW